MNHAPPLTASSRNPPMRLAALLHAYLAATRISRTEVCRQMGIDRSVLSRFLSGHTSLNAAAFARVLAWCMQEQAPVQLRRAA